MGTADRVITCPSCGARNRVPPPQSGRKAVCGKCRASLIHSSSPMHVTDRTFASDVEQNPQPVLLDLWADWCGPCHMLSPTIDELSSELAGRVTVAKRDIDSNPATAARFRVQSIPTLLLLKNGREVDRLQGVRSKQEILTHIEAVLR